MFDFQTLQSRQKVCDLIVANIKEYYVITQTESKYCIILFNICAEICQQKYGLGNSSYRDILRT